jgi:outer membrane protein assembly factor BamB
MYHYLLAKCWGENMQSQQPSSAASKKLLHLFIVALLLAMLAITLLAYTHNVHADASRTNIVAAGASITLSATYGPPTSSIQVQGKGFKSSETITLTFDTIQVGKLKASSTGTFTTTFDVPSMAVPGSHVVKSKGNTSRLLAQAVFQVRTDWVQLGFNRAHTSFNVFENVLNPTNISNLTQYWSASIGAWDASPAIVNNIAYVGSIDGNVYALNATNGSLLWSQSFGSDSGSSPAVVNNVVYISLNSGTLYALNATNGTQIWSVFLGVGLAGPTVVNNVIYVSSQNNVYALNATTGTRIWQYPVGGFPTTYYNKIVYVSSQDGGGDTLLYALNALNGKVLWNYSLGGDWYSNTTTAVVANGIIYVGFGSLPGNGGCSGDDGGSGDVYALNATSGTLLWETSAGFCDASTAVTNNTVYVGGADGSVNALNAITGKIVWSFNVNGNFGKPIYSAPTVANGVVYISNGDLLALNATNGTILWTHSFNNTNYASPVVVNGVVYLIAQDGNMYAFHI